jgi:hypothetical protein
MLRVGQESMKFGNHQLTTFMEQTQNQSAVEKSGRWTAWQVTEPFFMFEVR